MNYDKFLEKYNVKQPNNPLHYYDYKAAYEAGVSPDETGHWPSKFKGDMHPNRYIQQDGKWYDTKYNQDADIEDVLMQEMQRKTFEEGIFLNQDIF